jgi:hypothetical protein
MSDKLQFVALPMPHSNVRDKLKFVGHFLRRIIQGIGNTDHSSFIRAGAPASNVVDDSRNVSAKPATN